MKKLVLLCSFFVLILSCGKNDMFVETKSAAGNSIINEEIVTKLVNDMKSELAEEFHFRVERGVKQVAVFWRDSDGTVEEFRTFCKENFVADNDELHEIFNTINENFETLNGHINKMVLNFKFPLHVDQGPINRLQHMFGAYNPGAHITDDFFTNKIAFFITLNFPYYTLEEKKHTWKGLDAYSMGLCKGRRFDFLACTRRHIFKSIRNFNAFRSIYNRLLYLHGQHS